MAKVMAQKEQAQKHTEEQGRRESYKKHLEGRKSDTQDTKRKKTFIEESKQNDNIVEFSDEDQL